MYKGLIFRIGSYYAKCMLHVKNYSRTVKWWQIAAEQDYAKAQYNFAQCYANGYGVIKDCSKAVELWIKAVDHGFAEAKCDFGIYYENGNGVSKIYSKAVEWYQKRQIKELFLHNLNLLCVI